MSIDVRLEDPGQSEELEVVRIAVQAGATVSAGDALVEIATDKANVDIVAPAAGVVREILVSEGDIVPPDQIFVVLDEA